MPALLRFPLLLEAQTHLHKRIYFVQAEIGDGVGCGGEGRRMCCSSAPSDFPSHGAKPLTLGQEAVFYLEF